jgi:DNA (cytosine-5)-methyltransferase 1
MKIEKRTAIEETADKKFIFQNLDATEKAILTHFLHFKTCETENHFEKEALHILENLEEKTHQELFSKAENAPFLGQKNYTFKFIDLFAGIGGFRLAMQKLGGKCVFSSEWDKDAQQTYFDNFGEFPFGDITQPSVKNYIPQDFDVLCAGFPCQPFSKGGFRNGFEDTRGTLFFDLCEIIEKHQPSFVFLENVANLVSHDHGNTYQVILESLDKLGYFFPLKPLILSPDKFGVPILRPRVYIPCVRKDIAATDPTFIKEFEAQIEKKFSKNIVSIDTILDQNIKNELTDYENKILEMWNEFYQGVDLKIIGFPIWEEYFKFSGDLSQFPGWKAKFIEKNVALYQRNKDFIEHWLTKHNHLDWCINTHRKMEWQAGNHCESVFDCLIQFRPSGVRIKRPDKFSTLVAMNHQQIIGKLRRKISINESKLLQSFPPDYRLSSANSVAMKQLGNSVNVKVLENIFTLLRDKFFKNH